MDNFKDLFWILLGEIFTIGGGIVSIGGLVKLESILLNITFIEYSFLIFKTLVLGMIGAFGGLLTKTIWQKITGND